MIMGNNNKFLYYWVLFVLVFLFSWWSHPSLIPKTSPDTSAYINIAENFSHERNTMRPFFFPLFIKTCMWLSESNWNILFSICQILFHASLCLVLFLFYQKLGLKPVISFILVMVIGFNPNILFYTTYVVPDYLFGVLITMSWMMFIILMVDLNKGKIFDINIQAFVFGLLNGLASVTKQIWLYAIFPFIAYLIQTAGMNKKTLKISMIIILLNFSFYYYWSLNKNAMGQYAKLSDQTYYSINMASIRGGLVEYGKGTALYQYLEENQLIESARKCNGDDNDDFRTVYWAVPFSMKMDAGFAKKIIANVPFKFIFLQLSTWHTFFTKRMHFPNHQTNAFPYMTDSIRYLYIGSYNNLYRPLLVPLLICFLIMAKYKHYRILVISTLIVLIYFSMLYAIFSATPAHFIRYRVSVEYVLFFSALFPIGLALQNLKFNYDK